MPADHQDNRPHHPLARQSAVPAEGKFRITSGIWPAHLYHRHKLMREVLRIFQRAAFCPDIIAICIQINKHLLNPYRVLPISISRLIALTTHRPDTAQISQQMLGLIFQCRLSIKPQHRRSSHRTQDAKNHDDQHQLSQNKSGYPSFQFLSIPPLASPASSHQLYNK